MQKKLALVLFNKCKPELCDPETGLCPAVASCKKDILLQEDPFDEPMLFPSSMCVGCGDCVKSCPLAAIVVK